MEWRGNEVRHMICLNFARGSRRSFIMHPSRPAAADNIINVSELHQDINIKASTLYGRAEGRERPPWSTHLLLKYGGTVMEGARWAV